MFEIGNSLREARMRQGLDYSQVELATKIRAKYIKALEDEQFDVLPSGTYIKGFLRSYSEYLGLDGQLYVDEYKSRFIADGFEEAPRERRQPRIQQQRALEGRIVLLGLLGIAVVTALVIVAWKFGGSDSTTSTPPVVTHVQKPVAPKGLQFVGFHKGTYLEVRRTSATGPVLFQGTLKRGEQEFLVGRRFWLSIRRPAGVRFKLAGKPVSLPARRNLKVVVTPTKTARSAG
jgi:hypothetical protein